MVLQITPDVLDRVEFGRVSWQELQLDALIISLDVIPNQSAPVCSQPIPDDEQGTVNLPTQRPKELHQLRCPDRSGEQTKVKLPEGDTGNSRELVPRKAVLQYRCLSPRRPRAHPGRTFAQSGFVDEDDGLSPFFGVFFSAGQRWYFHWRMASSSRWVARPVGR